MTEYKKINEKRVWLVVKESHTLPRNTEYVGAYWVEETARRVAAQILPTSSQSFTISLNEITLHGLAVDIV